MLSQVGGSLAHCVDYIRLEFHEFQLIGLFDGRSSYGPITVKDKNRVLHHFLK